MISPTPFIFFQTLADALPTDLPFPSINLTATSLECAAPHNVPASYLITTDDAAIHISLVTPDRWLSESIEADLTHTGDKMEELLEEELIDLDQKQTYYKIDHYRDDQLRYTFRSSIPLFSPSDLSSPDIINQAIALLLAYQATFSPLGDMTPSDN